MSDLLWPGDDRCGDLFSDPAVLAAMVRVEAAWLRALDGPGDDLEKLLHAGDAARIAAAAESGGNPVIPLVGLLRDRLAERHPAAADRLHRGLTSQDVLDTALALCLADTVAHLRPLFARQISALAGLAATHRGTALAGRTLTQHAVPIPFGLKVAGWLGGVLDARDQVRAAAALPVQLGGAAGSLAAPVAVTGSPRATLDLVAAVAADLGLAAGPPWHTRRAPFTRIADAFVACTDAWGRLANDVLVGARPEIGELAEAAGGGSSTMPQKRNPVLSVLIRRAALAGPPLAATLHAAAAAAVDERPDGAWHVEWATLRTLARRTVTAAAQTADLLTGLRVDPDRMAATLASARPGIDAEQRRITGGTGTPYRGAADEIIDAVLQRAGEPW
ncbi:lyase family protein [Jidongwangia harbinensis]|uniref:lyase family protein n=1 Tax=Jidongwangia harbinensis TaxID=2878561 RepID=UPI001CD9C1E4|nr:lyase family protein [Jidongwangia harbinensis]MCA2218301.1 3-carboxy-cis,cis-muconate cycloisomerase [Jidongwangia harbinensis]